MADDSSEIVKEQSESVAATNLKVLGDSPAYYNSLAYQIGLDGLQGWRTINQAAVTQAVERLGSTQASESVGDTALAEILSKMAGNVPPVTP